MWSIFCAIKRSWTQHFVEQFSALVILLTTYMALVFIALSLTNIQSLFKTWGQVQQVSVYLKSGATEKEKLEVRKEILENPIVKAAQVVTPEESAKNFEERFSKATSQKFDSKQVSRFFPSYIVLDLDHEKAYKGGAETLDLFVTNLKTSFSSIKSVSYGKSWIQRYVGILAAIEFLGWFLIAVFFMASVIVSSSIVKTVLYSRRDEIEILEFIGADDLSIYLPQVINTLVISAIAFFTAVLVNLGVYQKLSDSSGILLSEKVAGQLQFISPLLLIGLFLSAVGSVALFSAYTIYSLLPRRKKALLIKEVIK